MVPHLQTFKPPTMTQTYKHLFIASLFVTLSFVPGFVFADENKCEQVKKAQENAVRKFDTHINKEEKEGSNTYNLLKKEIEQKDINHEDARKKDDQKLSGQFMMLRKSASSPDEKKNIEKFIMTLVNASNAQRSAIDTARNTYKQEILSTLSVFDKEEQKLLHEYQNNIKKSYEEAYNSCNSGTSKEKLKEKLKSDTSTHSHTFFRSINTSSTEAQIKSAKNARDNAITEANNLFSLKKQKAIEELASSLKNSHH